MGPDVLATRLAQRLDVQAARRDLVRWLGSLAKCEDALKVLAKKDLIDAVSRLYDMEPVSPTLIDERMLEPETYADGM